jgi:alkylation response protein AidB-like acyl-CoA dehydrogenase
MLIMRLGPTPTLASARIIRQRNLRHPAITHVTTQLPPYPHPVPPALLDIVRGAAEETDVAGRWPSEQLRACAGAGLLHTFAPTELGGAPRPSSEVLRMLAQLASACLSTAFTLTQPAGVISRLAACDNDDLRRMVIPDLLSGQAYGAVGIAQLTTSRRHVTKPILSARETDAGYVLDGQIPWVTGGAHADWIVAGAPLDDGRQMLSLVPTDLPGLVVEPAADMVGLSATSTGPVRCDGVLVERKWLMAPVTPDVLKFGKGAGTGGLQTSALALGSARGSIELLAEESARRADLEPVVDGLCQQWRTLDDQLATLADGPPSPVAVAPATVASAAATSANAASSPADEIRTQANSLALRSAQAALAATKGSGYVRGHPAGRRCREALFFLVWSCPQPVMSATLCELGRL